MKTYPSTNKNLIGQFAVTRPAKGGNARLFVTRFYKSVADAIEARGRIGEIAKVTLVEGSGTKKIPTRIVSV